MNQELEKMLNKLIKFSRLERTELFLVGGAVRDLFLKRDSSDYDFTGSNAIQTAKKFANKYHYPLVKLDTTPGRETFRVVGPEQNSFDFTTLQGKSIQEDLLRRDFTVNAMAIPIESCLNQTLTCIDPGNGQVDLKQKKIRVVSAYTFKEDPLRILRAFRFSAQLNFKIDTATADQIRKYVSSLEQVATERIFYELKQFLNAEEPSKYFTEFCDSGLLGKIFPKSESHKNYITTALEILDSVITDPAKLFGKISNATMAPEFPQNIPLLRISAILYPAHAHEKLPAVETLKGMKASNAEIKWVSSTMLACSYAHKDDLKFEDTCEREKQMYPFAKASYPHTLTGLALACSMKPEWTQSRHENIQRIAKYYIGSYLPAKRSPNLLNGSDLIEKFNLQPGPHFKLILDKIEDAKILGEIVTREQAIKLARTLKESFPEQAGGMS